MLALQYFYKQDMEQCKKYLDRAVRGKLEGANSSSKRQVMSQGFRSSDDPNYRKVKRIYLGAAIQRSSTFKVSNAVVQSYEAVEEMIEKARSGSEFRPSIKQMVDEVTNKFICNRIVRPSTPVMTIPEHKLLSPSEATQDHMLLPNLSVFQM